MVTGVVQNGFLCVMNIAIEIKLIDTLVMRWLISWLMRWLLTSALTSLLLGNI